MRSIKSLFLLMLIMVGIETWAATYTIAWSVNGEIVQSQNLEEGDAVTAPTVVAPDGKVFLGWVITAIDGMTDIAPQLVEPMTTATAEVTYYAVFATRTGYTNVTYTKLASKSFDPLAEYVLAAEESDKNTTLHYFSSYTGTTADESYGITSTDADDAIILTLSGTADELVAKDASGNYIEALAANRFKMSSECTSLNLHSNGTIYNPSKTEYSLRYYHANGLGGFRWYFSNQITGTYAYFYKKDGVATYSDYCTTITTSFVVNISPAGYTTLFLPYAVTIPDGVQAYTGVLSSNKLTMTELEDVIPTHTAVVLKASAGEYSFKSTTSGPFSGNNDLKGCLTETVTSSIEGGIVCTLAKEEDIVGFFKFTGETLGANKAYLVVPETMARISMSFDDDTEALESVVTDRNTTIYTLDGMKVTELRKGLNIVNGKKVMVME